MKIESIDLDFFPESLARLLDDDGELTIVFQDNEGARLTLTWDFTHVYRKMDEGTAIESFAEFGRSLERRALSRVTESRFLAWFLGESHGVVRSEGLKHYIACSSNDIVDVIALDDPLCTYRDQAGNSYMLSLNASQTTRGGWADVLE